MIIVTGGAGFIGSNLVAGLNQHGRNDIMVVDHLKEGRKMYNLADLDICDYLDRDDFIARIHSRHDFGQVEALFHQGASSATTEWDGQFVMRNNYEYSKTLLHWCQDRRIPFLYASSASIYGNGKQGFREELACEAPINMYAYSKFQFDQYVRRMLPMASAQIVGLRYFNVYGPREFHKGPMASTSLHFINQINSEGTAKLFQGSDGFANGEQRRDFVYVSDCVDVNLWFFEHSNKSGIFNCGTGRAQSFNDMVEAVIRYLGKGHIEYIPFPDQLKGAYQSFTQADLTKLRSCGCEQLFTTIAQGIDKYLAWWKTNAKWTRS